MVNSLEGPVRLTLQNIFRKRIEEVDIGTIEVSLALSAISALLTSKENFLIIRILASGAFVLSSFGAGILFYYYLYQKIPTSLVGGEQSRERGIRERWLRLFFSFFFLPNRKNKSKKKMN